MSVRRPSIGEQIEQRLVTAGRRPSVPVSDLRGHFFTAK
jgi:hypothetical protein